MYDDDELPEIKLIFVGEKGVGKTNIISRLMDKEFDENSKSNISAAISIKFIEVKKKVYKVNIWDTVGQEKYRAISNMFLNGADIVFFIYQIDRRKSFEELQFWLKKVDEVCGPNTVKAIIANKSDLFEDEEVTAEEGKKFAKKNGCEFALLSAKVNENNAIKMFAETMIKNYVIEKYDDSYNKERKKNSIKIENYKYDVKKDEKKKGGCCN